MEISLLLRKAADLTLKCQLAQNWHVRGEWFLTHSTALAEKELRGGLFLALSSCRQTAGGAASVFHKALRSSDCRGLTSARIVVEGLKKETDLTKQTSKKRASDREWQEVVGWSATEAKKAFNGAWFHQNLKANMCQAFISTCYSWTSLALLFWMKKLNPITKIPSYDIHSTWLNLMNDFHSPFIIHSHLFTCWFKKVLKMEAQLKFFLATIVGKNIWWLWRKGD